MQHCGQSYCNMYTRPRGAGCAALSPEQGWAHGAQSPYPSPASSHLAGLLGTASFPHETHDRAPKTERLRSLKNTASMRSLRSEVPGKHSWSFTELRKKP
jgi:hypothetical protein